MEKVKRRRIKYSKGDTIFIITITILMAIIAFLALYPVYFVVIASVSKANAVTTGKVWFYPVGINFLGYQQVFANKDIISGYAWTVFISVLGTFLNLFMTIPMAYILSRKDFVIRKFVLWVFLIPHAFFSLSFQPILFLDDKHVHN